MTAVGPGAGEVQTKVSITIAVYYDCSWPRCWRRTDKSVGWSSICCVTAALSSHSPLTSSQSTPATSTSNTDTPRSSLSLRDP